MKVEVLYFEGCPNHVPTVQRVRTELESVGLPKEVQEVEVRNQEDAEALGFLGSPTVRVNGLDVEPEARNLKGYGMSCRTYVEGRVLSGLPSNNLIRSAINEQMPLAGSALKSVDSGCHIDSGDSTTTRLISASTSAPQSERSGSVALFTGGLAAILASTCCLGPLALVTVGVSGAWIGNLTRLEPYHPFFILIALVALFLAWKNIYRPVQECKPGEVCALPQAGGIYKAVFWASAALTLLALVYPYFAKYFY